MGISECYTCYIFRFGACVHFLFYFIYFYQVSSFNQLAQQRYIEAWKLDTALFNILCIQGGVTDAFDIRQEHDPTIPPYEFLFVCFISISLNANY